MTTIRLEKQGNYIIDEGTDINFDSHQEDGAAWNPTLPDEKLEGSFDTTISVLNTQNYVWNYITWVWEYWSGLTDPDTSILVQLLGISPDYEESAPLAEISITPTYPFSVVDETRTINLEDSISGSNLVLKDSLAGAGVVQVDLPIRWQHYIGATLNRVWLEGYTKRVHIPLTGSAAGVMELQPVLINLTYDADMKSDFSDVIFTDSDGCTELDYELVSKTDSTSAVFWVQTIEIDASPNVEYIYAYYGNEDATSLSDPTLVWDYYDDFEDGLYTLREDPYNNIYVNAGTGSITNISPIRGTYSFKHIGTGATKNLGVKYIDRVVDSAFSLIFTVKLTTQGTSASTPYISLIYFQYTDYKNWLRLVTWWDGSNQKIGLEKNVSNTTTLYGTATLVSGAKWSTGTSYTFRVNRNGSYWVVSKIVGGVQTALFSTTGDPGYTSVFGFGCQQDTEALWDNIKYHNPMNDVYGQVSIGTVGSEESTQTIDANTVSDETQQHITFNTPVDWTTKEPAYLTLTTIDNNTVQTHETMIQPTDTIQMTPHSPTPYYAIRLRFIVNSTDELGFNVHDIMGSYEYLENIE